MTANINWLSLTAAKQQLSSAHYLRLADDGSLTRRVRTACRGQFEVQLIDYVSLKPDIRERQLLNLPESAQALSRRVFLCCDQLPLIFARTIVGLVEDNRILTERITLLGAHSLGSILFRDPLAKKKQMWLASIPLNHGFFAGVAFAGLDEYEPVWVRRSLYQYEGCDLIVYEAFIRFLEWE